MGFTLQAKPSASFKDSCLFGVSLSDHVKPEFTSAGLRCKVSTVNTLTYNYFYVFLCLIFVIYSSAVFWPFVNFGKCHVFNSDIFIYNLHNFHVNFT